MNSTTTQEYWKIPKEDKLSGNEFLALHCLVKHMNEGRGDKLVWPKRQTIAEETGLNIKTIDSCLKSLEKKEYLKKLPQRRKKDGNWSSCCYEIKTGFFKSYQGAEVQNLGSHEIDTDTQKTGNHGSPNFGCPSTPKKRVTMDTQNLGNKERLKEKKIKEKKGKGEQVFTTNQIFTSEIEKVPTCIDLIFRDLNKDDLLQGKNLEWSEFIEKVSETWINKGKNLNPSVPGSMAGLKTFVEKFAENLPNSLISENSELMGSVDEVLNAFGRYSTSLAYLPEKQRKECRAEISKRLAEGWTVDRFCKAFSIIRSTNVNFTKLDFALRNIGDLELSLYQDQIRLVMRLTGLYANYSSNSARREFEKGIAAYLGSGLSVQEVAELLTKKQAA